MTTHKKRTKAPSKPKKPYLVLLTREATEHAFVVVRASSASAAEKAAIDGVDRALLKWEHNEGSEGEPYICDPAGTAEEITEQEAEEKSRKAGQGV